MAKIEKKVFAAVEQISVDGKWWKTKTEFKNLPREEKRKLSRAAFNTKIFLWGALFGALYYLVKGMWLKAIVYTIGLIGIAVVLVSIMQTAEPYYLSIVFGALASYDYYRYKVLGKQW